MREKDFQQKFHEWIRKSPPDTASAYELKICKSRAMPFSQVRSHQVSALLKVKQEGVYHKIADVPLSWGGNRFASKKPFDTIFIKGSAYIVILFYKPRMPKRAIFIDIDRFVAEQMISTRKSLTESRATEIADSIAVI